MKLSDLTLRCYGKRDDDGSWFTICLELNLYARGDSFSEAKEKLRKLVIGYMREALTKDREHFSDLVPRPAPMYFWAQYFCAWCAAKVHHHTKNLMKFKLPLPMVPAV